MIHAYKLFGHNIIIDVFSGSIHDVDEAAYDAILLREKMSGGGRVESLNGEISRNLGGGFFRAYGGYRLP